MLRVSLTLLHLHFAFFLFKNEPFESLKATSNHRDQVERDWGVWNMSDQHIYKRTDCLSVMENLLVLEMTLETRGFTFGWIIYFQCHSSASSSSPYSLCWIVYNAAAADNNIRQWMVSLLFLSPCLTLRWRMKSTSPLVKRLPCPPLYHSLNYFFQLLPKLMCPHRYSAAMGSHCVATCYISPAAMY